MDPCNSLSYKPNPIHMALLVTPGIAIQLALLATPQKPMQVALLITLQVSI